MPPVTVRQAFDLALQHHQAGRLAEAEALYRQILAVEPQHADALHLLGVIAQQVGRNDVAVDLIRRAIASDPNRPTFYSNLGVALSAQDRADDAIAAFRRALELKPDFAEAHCNFGKALMQQGRTDEAIAAYRRAIAFQAGYAEAHYCLGNALRHQGRDDDSIASYQHALRLRPNYSEAHNNLGSALRDCSRTDESIAAYRRAIEAAEDNAEAHNNLGVALSGQGKLDEAIAEYRRASQLKPDMAEAHSNLGDALRNCGQIDEAIAAYRRALQIKPDYSEAHNNLAVAYKDRNELDEALVCYRRAMTLEPHNSTTHSNLIYTLHFDPGFDAPSIADEHRRWDRQFAEPLRKFHKLHLNNRDPERRLRIGYVSPDFRHHVICHFLLPLLERHDHAGFEIHCYASVKRSDEITGRIRKNADVWSDVLILSDEKLAERIRGDEIDILVDLTQHMGDNRLPVFARKPAPVQVAWLGYPGSTGLSAMDYRLTDAWMEPEGAAWSESVETPVRLPDSWFCFDPIDDFPVPGELPALHAGHITFGCLNTFSKVSDAVLERWAGVMRAVENSRLLLRCPQGAAQARVREFFAARGIAAERLELVAWTPTRAEFLKLFDRMDIALDPFPYNGGTTTCEALWMGVPVLTLPGERIVSRIGLSILTACGMPEFVAHTEEEYVRLAADLAADLPRLSELRATLRGRMKASAFMDGARFAKHMEHAFRAMWRAWCAGRCSPPAS